MLTFDISRVRAWSKNRENQRPTALWFFCCWAGVVLFVLACRSVDQHAADNISSEILPEQEVWNTTIYLSRNGRREATVKAGHRSYFSDSNVTIINSGIHVQFYDDDGSLASTLEAERGEIDGLTHNLVVRGDVVVYSAERGTLTTDSLRWINAKNIVETDAAVQLISDNKIITGEGFEADPAMRRWIIRREIKGEFLPEVQAD